jgi:hypothetical protein
MPEGIDPSYFMSAPRDQALTVLRPDERIVLENLHPKHARLVTSLPGVEPRAFVELPHQVVTGLPLLCDTLWIDTDRSICTLTWRGQLALQRPTQEGQVVVAMAKAGRALTWAEVEPLTREGASPQGEDEEAEVNETILTHRHQPGPEHPPGGRVAVHEGRPAGAEERAAGRGDRGLRGHAPLAGGGDRGVLRGLQRGQAVPRRQRRGADEEAVGGVREDRRRGRRCLKGVSEGRAIRDSALARRGGAEDPG